MKAVLQTALAFFRFLTLQRALNAIGALLFALAVALLVMSHADLATLAGVLGAVTIVLTPVMAGGLALRFYLSQPTLALRPHGRGRVMLGATLAITLVAALVVVPVVVARLALLHEQPAQPTPLFPFFPFAMVWTATALLWIVVFIINNSRTGIFLLLVLPVTFSRIGPRLVALVPHAPWVLGIGAVAWTVFMLWYLRPHPIRRPAWMGGRAPVPGDEAPQTASPHESCSRGMAERQYLLGNASLCRHVLIGLGAFAFVALLMLWMSRTMAERQTQLPSRWPIFFLTYLAVFGMSMGYSIARRARLLWLRAGLDRTRLFLLAERAGLTAACLTIGGAAIPLMLWQAVRTPDSSLGLLVSVLAVLVLAANLFYLGMALTRGWNIADILLGTGLLGLLVAHVVVLVMLQEAASAVPAKAPLLIVVSAVLAALLRIHARHRWQRLDWRKAMLPPLFKRIA